MAWANTTKARHVTVLIGEGRNDEFMPLECQSCENFVLGGGFCRACKAGGACSCEYCQQPIQKTRVVNLGEEVSNCPLRTGYLSLLLGIWCMCRTAPKGDRDVASAASSSTATRRARRGAGSNTKSSVLAWICGQCHLQAGVHRQRLAALQRAALQRIAHLDWTCFSATGRRRRRKDAERNNYNPLTHN